MKMIRKPLLIGALLLVVALLAAGCASQETPYQINDKENYTVSIQFDANGGAFADNTHIITDSYNISALPKDDTGMVQIPLLAPDDARRNKDAFTPAKTDCFLAGWYAERTEHTDENGNVTYTYAKPWNFETDTLPVDPNGSYTSDQPVFTLYAAWAPLYQLELYDVKTGEFCGKYTFDPTNGTQLKTPQWNAETGALEMYRFPQRSGYTLLEVYYDAQGTQPVNTETIEHPGTVNLQNAVVENGTMKLYGNWQEGTWYRISSAEQFVDNYSLDGCYDIQADLDFTDAIWPTAMMYGSFSGTIQGNGHTICNISIIQKDNGKSHAGLFGQLAAEAKISNVHFENVTFTVQKGVRVTGTSFGLLAGTVADGAALSNVTVAQSQLLIDSDSAFLTDDYAIGLICGMGNVELDATGVTCQATGSNPESVNITVTDGAVTVEFVTENE